MVLKRPSPVSVCFNENVNGRLRVFSVVRDDDHYWTRLFAQNQFDVSRNVRAISLENQTSNVTRVLLSARVGIARDTRRIIRIAGNV